MDGAQLATIAIACVGGGGVFGILLNGIFKRLDGRAGEERARNADMKTQRDDAWAERDRQEDRASREQKRADREARNRNRWADLYALLRRRAIAAGMDEGAIPTQPEHLEEELP